MTLYKYFLTIFVVSIFSYGIFSLVFQSYIKMAMVENELAVILELMSEKDVTRPTFDTKPKSKDKTLHLSQLELIKVKLETMRNELEQIRESSFQRANFALESNGAKVLTVFEKEVDFNMCFLRAIFGNGCNFANVPRHLIRVSVRKGLGVV